MQQTPTISPKPELSYETLNNLITSYINPVNKILLSESIIEITHFEKVTSNGGKTRRKMTEL